VQISIPKPVFGGSVGLLSGLGVWRMLAPLPRFPVMAQGALYGGQGVRTIVTQRHLTPDLPTFDCTRPSVDPPVDDLGSGNRRTPLLPFCPNIERSRNVNQVSLREVEDGGIPRLRQPLPELLLNALLLGVIHLTIIPPPVGTAQTR
jgi:hypothetical protein